ncbi:MAG TPA: Rrf2 family transcriptional regulator [Polyangiaceae bacterium]|nr:Rrf2 family transcriptional regulator [Polyangiaceae bacterium]
MQLTLFSDYSLRILLYLAAHRGERIALPEISAAYGISQHHLVKVVQRLIEEGWVESTRGRGGGLTLACEPAAINVGTVVRATEPHLNLVECFDSVSNTCPIDGACGLKRALARARDAFFEELERHTLADFAPKAPALIKLWKQQLDVDGTRPTPAQARKT